MNNKRIRIWSTCLLGALMGVASGSVFSISSSERWLEVHVLDKQSGDPVSDAAVCLGITARPDQFGAMRSSKDGVVRFENLTQRPVTLLTTISKSGYRGLQQRLEPLYQSRVLIIKLASGGGGPQCDAQRAQARGESGPGLVIEHISVKPDATAGRVLVSVKVTGGANQVRISEQADFGDASWQKLEPAVAYTTSQGKGVKQIYVQVRRQASTEGASIEVVSEPGSIRYRVR